MSTRLCLLPILLCLPLVAWCAAPELPGVGIAMQAAIDAREIAGAVTVVVTTDRIVHLQASGLADIAAGKPMQPDSLFWIASMTKPVTAVAVLMLQDEGKLSVTDPVAKYILMVQRSNFPNSDASDVRRAFQQAAAEALAGAARSSAEESGRFVVVPVDNPRYCGNEMFRAFEDYFSPRVRQLRARYRLDAVVAGETDEWKRILLLRHWIKSNIAIDNDHPTPAREEAFAILDAALQGGKFHCTHFSIVQHAVLNSFGYVARRLGCGPGLKDDGGHHGVNEVWVNKFSKWVLIDAKYDAHFEKDGVPLSALEIRDEVWRDGARSVICVVGPDRRAMKPDPGTGRSETRPDTYRWCSWETDTNRFTAFPARPTSTLVMLDDENFRRNTWYRDGKPHWAYDTPYLLKTSRRDWIEWTPNVITSKVTIEGNKARVFLSSCTPNFRTFQRMDDRGTWQDCGEEVELSLDQRGRTRCAFRAINLFEVAGPEHHVEIAHQPHNS